MDVEALVGLLRDASEVAYSLRVLINRSISEENQLPIFQTITLPRLIELLNTHRSDEEILPLIVWLCSHLALNEEAGNAMLQSSELVLFHSSLLEHSNKLLSGKTLWLLNNLSLLEESHALGGIIGSIVDTMKRSMECGDMETFITCCDIVLNLIHKDTCVDHLQIQSDFVGAKGLEVILNAIDANDSDSDVLNVTSAILELISAYLGECRVKIIEVGLIRPLVHMGRSTAEETRAAREQALKVIFNLSFLAGMKECDKQLIQHDCISMVVEQLLQDPPDENMQKIGINILANLLVSEPVRGSSPKDSLAYGIARVAKNIRSEQTVMLSSLISAIANAAMDDECRKLLRENGIDAELQRLSQTCHPSLKSIISAAQDNMKLEEIKSPPIFLDLLGNNSGFVGRLLNKRSSLSPSSKREIKPRVDKPKETIADMLYAVPIRQYSRFLSGGIGNDEWKD